MMRTIGAVLAGYTATTAMVVCTDRLLAHAMPGTFAHEQPECYFFVSLISRFASSVAGSWLSASIAGPRARDAMWGLITFGEALGLGAMVLGWQSTPHWYALSAAGIFPLAVWSGWKLRPRHRRQ